MSAEEEKKPGGEKGFAGLSSMVSVVDTSIIGKSQQPQTESFSSSTKQSSQAKSSARQENPIPVQQTYKATEQPTGESSAGKWIFGVAALLGFIWLADLFDSNNSPRSTYTPAPSSTSVVPTPTVTAQPQTNNSLNEEIPPIGRNNVLSSAQILYCLAEEIRLDAAESVMNNHSNSDINRFNEYVNDYNSRCTEYRYQKSALENAQMEIEAFNIQLQAEGRVRGFLLSLTSAPQTTAQTPLSARPSPDATIQAIQRILNELGYDAGDVDGIFGAMTQRAIEVFQQANGIVVDGIANPILLVQLQASSQAIRDEPPSSASTSVSSSQTNSGIPQNASLNYLGTGWECNRGYYKWASGCSVVQVPQNASLNYLGSGWECNRGYFKAGSECSVVRVPQNASLNYLGSGWECNRGYRRSGNACLPN